MENSFDYITENYNRIYNEIEAASGATVLVTAMKSTWSDGFRYFAFAASISL